MKFSVEVVQREGNPSSVTATLTEDGNAPLEARVYVRRNEDPHDAARRAVDEMMYARLARDANARDRRVREQAEIDRAQGRHDMEALSGIATTGRA